jgi:transcriptional regulator with XRE-family HTH domain
MTKLEFERRRRGWTQTTLAFYARGTQADISSMECRRLIPTPRVAARYAHALGIAPSELLDEVHADPRTFTRPPAA